MAVTPEPLNKTEADLRTQFVQQLRGIPDGEKISQCIQCGTCTGSCPVSYAMDVTPRQAIALYRAGHLEDLLKSRTIWLCASCYSCTVRCPSGIKITDMMYALKRLASKRNIYPPKFAVHNLSKVFTNTIYKYGRSYELGLGIRYFLKVDPPKLLASAGFGMKMFRRGRLGLTPHRIKRVNELRAIIRKANKLEE